MNVLLTSALLYCRETIIDDNPPSAAHPVVVLDGDGGGDRDEV